MAAYRNLLRKYAEPFPCPHCDDPVSVERFESHCLERHGLDPDRRCAWCFGHVAWTEVGRTPHVRECVRDFVRCHLHPAPSPLRFAEPTVLDVSAPPDSDDDEEDGKKTRKKKREEEDGTAVDLPPWKGPAYRHPALELGSACVRLFADDVAAWYHVAVRTDPAFASALRAAAGSVRTLPFSCRCDAGDARHRHWIVRTAPTAASFWKRLSVRKKPIASPARLVETLLFLGGVGGDCELYGEGGAPTRRSRVALPPNAELVLHAQWDGGLEALIRRRHASVRPDRLIPFARALGGEAGPWVVRVGDLPFAPVNVVLPVTEAWTPCEKATAAYACLGDGRRLYFEETTGDDAGDDWAERQAKAGNAFCNAIADAWYHPTPYQQRCLGVARPLADKILELEWVVARSESARSEAERLARKRSVAERSLKRKLDASEKELKAFHRRHIAYLERENDFLRLENRGAKVAAALWRRRAASP